MHLRNGHMVQGQVRGSAEHSEGCLCNLRNVGATCEATCLADPTCYGFIFKSECPLIKSARVPGPGRLNALFS